MMLNAAVPMIPEITLLAQAASYGSAWSLSLQILIGVALIQAWIIFRLFLQIQRLQKGMQEVTESTALEGSTSGLNPLFAKALTGSLDRFSMGEVIQFLNSIRETGILDIVDPSVSEVHRLVLRDGEIVDAFNGDLRGEPAASAIFRCREGHFTFIRGDVTQGERRITTPTMTLLMEAYKQADELQLDFAQAV